MKVNPYWMDWLAQILAEADDQSWGTMETPERDRYRKMAKAAIEAFDDHGWFDPEKEPI